MAWLEVLSGAEQGTLLPLKKGRSHVGSKAELKVGDPWVSAQHAVIFYNAGSYWLEDLESVNGTYVAKAKVKKVQLTDRTEFFLGKTRCRFLLDASGDRAAAVSPAAAADATVQQAASAAAASASRAAEAAEDAARAVRKARPGALRWMAGKLFLPGLLVVGLLGAGAYATLPLRTNEARLLLLAEYSRLRPIGSLVLHRTSADTLIASVPGNPPSVRKLVGVSEVGLRFVVFPDAEVYEFRGLEDWWRAGLVYFGEQLTTGTRVAIVQIAYGDENGSEYDGLDTALGNGSELYAHWKDTYATEDNTLNSSFIPVDALPIGEALHFNLWGDQRGAFIGLKPRDWTPPQQGDTEEEGD